ncbi:hypothetical protein SSUST1_0219 [Streptococcus suis ST1]|nr:hypothetical protein SSUST1_0219 [Streptococcus suis ST1]
MYLAFIKKQIARVAICFFVFIAQRDFLKISSLNNIKK